MTELRLLETIHPTREGMRDFNALFGIDSEGRSLEEIASPLSSKTQYE